MKKIYTAAVVCILIGVIAGAVHAQQSPTGVVPPLYPSEQIWVFGYIPKDAQVTHHFALTNFRSDTVVTITKLVPGCDCTHVPKTPIAVQPGETYLLEVRFDTKTYFGDLSRDVHVETDYEANPTMDLYFGSAVGMSPRTVSLTPVSTAFITGKNEQSFTLTNLADVDAEVTILIDHDSTLVASPSTFTLKGKKDVTFTISPEWDKIPRGSHYRSVVVEVARDQVFRITIPIKINRF